MDRTVPSASKTRTSDRSALIRTSMLLFALLAVASFALARVVA